MTDDAALLAIAFFAVAVLYSTVGHAGASGYLALMALLGVAPATMRPTALALNVLVAAVATYRFRRAGWTGWNDLLPFVLASVPFAYLGGLTQLPVAGYRAMLGCVLIFSAAVMLWRASGGGESIQERPLAIPRSVALGSGAAIGLLSGLTGTGGGIFLSPLLLLAGWAGPRGAAGLAAPFILLNSIAGLLGFQWSQGSLPAELPLYAAAVVAGGLLGTTLGLQFLRGRWLLVVLALVLCVAGGKLLLTR
jgi:uncharacterized membrane protein YfcA